MFTGYPSIYSADTDFSAESEFSKDLLDPEFDAIGTFTQHVIAILKAVLRDDWKLKDDLVTYESLSLQVRNLITGGNGWTGQGPFVSTLEGLTGSIDLDGANGITIVLDGQKITITAPDLAGTFADSVNGITGPVTIAEGAGTTITMVGDTITVAVDFAVVSSVSATAAAIAAALASYASLNVVQEYTKAQYVQPYNIPYSATPTADFDQSNNFKLILAGDAVLGAAEIHEGQSGQIVIIQNGAGGRELTFTADFVEANGVAIEIDDAPSAVTVLNYVAYDGAIYLSAVAVASPADVTIGEMAVRGANCKNNAATPDTIYDLQADSIVLRGASNTVRVFHNPGAAIECDLDAPGTEATPNGRDQAADFGPDTWLYFYWITDGVTLATIASETPPPTGPTLPTGYTHWAYAGAVRFDGTSALVKTRIKGSRAYYEARQQVLTSGASTVEAAVSIEDYIPPEALSFTLSLHGITNGSDTVAIKIVSGATFSTLSVLDTNDEIVDVPNINQSFIYNWAGTAPTRSLDAFVMGYTLSNGGE